MGQRLHYPFCGFVIGSPYQKCQSARNVMFVIPLYNALRSHTVKVVYIAIRNSEICISYYPGFGPRALCHFHCQYLPCGTQAWGITNLLHDFRAHLYLWIHCAEALFYDCVNCSSANIWLSKLWSAIYGCVNSSSAIYQILAFWSFDLIWLHTTNVWQAMLDWYS